MVKIGESMMDAGDLVRIVLRGVCDPEIIGTIIYIAPVMPHIPTDSAQRPGPIFNLKILKLDGSVWASWIDQQDEVEILQPCE